MFTKKSIILPLVATVSILAPLAAAMWEQPTTKGRLALVLEVGPGFLFKDPSGNASVLYQMDSNGNLAEPFPNKKNVKWKAEVGIRALAQVIANNKESAEFIYTGLFNWTTGQSASDSTTGVGVLTAPYTTTDWKNAAKVLWSNKTSYNSYDGAMWWHVTPRFEDYFSFSILAGGRAINIQDADFFSSYKTLTALPSVLKAVSSNWLSGGQVGLEVYCRPLSYFSWAIQGRGGVFADSVSRTTYITDLANTTVVADVESNDKTKVAGLIEGIPYITLQSNRVYAKLLGSVTYIANISASEDSFLKVRKVTDIKFDRKFFIVGGFLDVGYIF